MGKRQASIDRTHEAILAAAAGMIAAGPAHDVSLAEVARQAGVSRVTVYNRFGSRAGLLRALVPSGPSRPPAGETEDPGSALRQRLAAVSARWAANPALHRHLGAGAEPAEAEADRALVERLAAADRLRPGCSIKEAEDVIAAVSSFAVFDRLYKDGRRSPAAVADILVRLVSTVVV